MRLGLFGECQECEEGTHTCDPHATCTNTHGSFTCECNEEFYGDGSVCAECTKCPIGYEMEGEGEFMTKQLPPYQSPMWVWALLLLGVLVVCLGLFLLPRTNDGSHMGEL